MGTVRKWPGRHTALDHAATTMTAIENTQWSEQKSIDHPRREGYCPVCGSRFGRTERIVSSDDTPGLKYWHTDLPDTQIYCVEWATGATQELEGEIEQSEIGEVL